MMTGCAAANGTSEFPVATGTLSGVEQVTNLQLKKSAFLGFTGLSYAGPDKTGWINRIHFEWLYGNDYDTPIGIAMLIANNAYPIVQNWGPTVLGYGLLEYNGNASR